MSIRATKLNVEEAFGPVAFLIKFDDFDEALDIVNDSKFGLQAGIFTRDLFQMFDAWDRLEVGGVVINDVPSYRVDNMPYGGVKDSGPRPRGHPLRDGGHDRDQESRHPPPRRGAAEEADRKLTPLSRPTESAVPGPTAPRRC